MPAANVKAAIISSFVPTNSSKPDFSFTPSTRSQRDSNSDNSNSIVPATELISETASLTMPIFLPTLIKPNPFGPATNILPDPTGDDTTKNICRSTRPRVPTQRLKEGVDMGIMQGFEAALEDE